jgi:hypothetical protein
MMTTRLWLLIGIALAALAPAPGAPPYQHTIDFARDIEPILAKNCYECHDAKKQKAHLRLDSAAAVMRGSENGAVVIPGNSEKSPIVRRLLGLDGEDRMPKDEDPLPAAQIALIRAWIDQGAPLPAGTEVPPPV